MKLIAVLLLATVSSLAQTSPAVRTDMLVSTAWLAEHLSDPKVVVLHVGSKADYDSAHIPGARLATPQDFIKNDAPGVELPPAEELKKALEKLGVSDDSRIVIYAYDWQPQAARLWFTLDYLGHGNHAALLNGGIEQWIREKRQLSTDSPEIKAGELTVRPRPDVLASIEEVKKGMAALLDTRPLYRYRAGHIRGAAPLFWEKMLVSPEEPILRAPDDLRKLFTAAGAGPGTTVIPYCEVGYQSSFGYFVARYLGYDAHNYDGSFSEWRGMKKEPVVRGDARQ